jgi:hypothetical protein
MKRLNILGVDTPHGFRTVELFEGDITALEFPVDILVLSAFQGDYSPTPGTILGALQTRCGISIAEHARQPALDLREALSIWVSEVLPEPAPFSRALCVELVGSAMLLEEAVDNVFAGLMLLSAKGVPTGVVVLPILGAGSQGLDPDHIAAELVRRAEAYLQRSPGTAKIVFAEIDPQKARLMSDAIDRVLGRSKVNLPHEQLSAALRQDVAQRLHHADSLFLPDCAQVRDDWLRVLQQAEVRSVELGVNARKLVELMLTRLGVPAQPLYKRIRLLEEGDKVAPWICAYMHVLRHLGNESAHENAVGSTREPPVIAPADLIAGLFCVRRLLDFWIDWTRSSVA